ncbi:CRISPR-associated helicase/endonuclease Cas3 [hot springs metagenome]|uniref:CRISPR-associated helicase/endonuclease Cas3 n=1 Tax=hot springs metagenome TaxID=433727 RepID=A0A5J4L7E7_9ZZZZ
MQEILAKSKAFESKGLITLKEHTRGLLEQLEKFKNILNNQAIDYELLRLAIFAHDIGKVSPAFQISVGNWDYLPKVSFPDVPHSLFSLLWIDKQKLAANLSDKHDLKILLSAVAFHHWRDNFHNIILGNDHTFIRAVEQILQNKELKTKLLENLKGHFNSKDFEMYFDILDFDEDIALTIREGTDLFPYIDPPYYSYFLPQRMSLDEEYKKKWVYTVGLLMRTDHFTSFIQEEELLEEIEKPLPEYSIVENNLKDSLSKKLNKAAIEDKEIWQINDTKGKRDNNLILIAPTGSGKTEFAYLWGAGNKLFITLPLRSAVNAIYERSKNIFGQENVGLIHSDADVYLYEKSLNHECERFRVLDLARHLSLPVLVSTGDQIFPSALKYPGYEKIYSTLGYSRLVIDEVQAYDPRAAAIIVKLIEDIVKLGGRFLLMTATLPSFVRQQIENRIGENNFEVIDKYKDYEGIQKHKIEICEDDITKRINEIMNKAKEGNRVLVILNTVETAQKIYEEIAKINKDNIYLKLLHSRFTFNDRKSLEDEIVGTEDKQGTFANPKPDSEHEGKILVATQVVEASLNIDADILYTELAPIDSLVQRMGRVLRRIRDKETYKKYLDAKEPSVSNIIIFYQKPGDTAKLSSGAGSVYQNDLLAFSLALLFRGAKPELISDTKIDELKKIYWREEKEKKGKSKAKVKDALKGFLEDLFEAVGTVQSTQTKGRGKNKNNETRKTLIFPVFETDKKILVENLYDLLPLKAAYLQRFYETLEILDAGYMSDRKQEALKIFREIYTAPAIPISEKDKFKEDLEDYLERAMKEMNYTSFKALVLSKYIVNVDAREYLKSHGISLSSATQWIYELGIQDEKKLKKIKKWLADIYVVECDYNTKIGILSERSKYSDNFL